MAGKINKKLIENEILNSRITQKLILEKVQEEIDKNKQIFINEFASHPVTQEIEGGSTASNSSGSIIMASFSKRGI
jgi:hypothetical protein